jgi:hypothetical protein
MGQSKYKNRKSVKEVSFKRSTGKDVDQKSEAIEPLKTVTQQSVAERLKNSLASFKSNKLTMDKDKNKSTIS